ncbi:MAG: VCBS repeat-containing protein [Planctomycetes bacterium]|nr:VCBS repeat-containing protein [Planctomycetota bacterium]
MRTLQSHPSPYFHPVHDGLWRLSQASLALCLLLTAGCGSGAVVVASAASGSGSGSANSPTQVSLLGIASTRESPARINYLLSDAESNSSSVEVRFTTDGTFAGSTLIEASPPLPASPAGTLYFTDWDFASIFGSILTPNVVVFVTLAGKANVDLGVNAATIAVGDDPPGLDIPAPQFPPIIDEVSGIIPVSFTAFDSGGDDVKIKVQYSKDFASPTPTWTNARPAGILATAPTPEFAFDPVTAFPFGSSLIFAWDSEFDLPGQDGPVQLRIQSIEIVPPGLQSTLAVSPAFRVDNNVPPAIGMDVVGFALNPDRSRGIPVPFVLDDPEGDAVKVVFQWREQSGSFPALPGNILAIQTLLADPAQRRAAQIATELPRLYHGRVLSVNGGDRARLPELATTAALLNTRRPAPSTSLVGLDLEILRASRTPTAMSPTWTAGNPLLGPIAAIESETGELFVLDEPSAGNWRLRVVNPATGAIGTTFATSQVGKPTALAAIPGTASMLVAAQAGTEWSIWMVDPLAPQVTELFRSDLTLPPGPVRGLLAMGDQTCVVTVGNTLVRIRFPGGTSATAALLLGTQTSSPLSAPHGLALDPRDRDCLYIADNGSNRVLCFSISTHSVSPLRTPSPGTPRPTALAIDDGGTRLLVLTDANPGDATRELRAFAFGLHRALGQSSLEAFVITSTLPSSTASCSTGADGLRVLCSAPGNELLVGGGVEQTRRILSYEPLRQTVHLETPFQPAVAAGARWRIADVSTNLASGSSQGERVFVWDSLDVAGSANVELRAVAFDKDLGPLAPSAPKTLFGAHGDAAQSIGNCCVGFACDLEGDGDIDFLSQGAARLQSSPMLFTTIPNSLPGIDKVADFNVDGLIDVVFDGQVFLQSSASAGVFLAGVTAVPGGGAVVDVADADGNGRVDLLLQDGRTFLQSPGGVWTPGPTASGAVQALLRDFDGDGDLDQLVAYADFGQGDYTISWFPRAANGNFGSTPIPIMGAFAIFASMAVEDLDLDGGLDVAVALDRDDINALLGGTDIRLSDGSPILSMVPPPGSTGLSEIEAADLDGDGLRELLLVSDGPISSVSYQAGPGLFSADSRGLLSTRPTQIADVDGDGLLDLVDVQVNFSRTRGTLRDISPTNIGSAFNSFSDCAFGDFDRDGDNDLFVVDPFVAMTQMFPQIRPGVFDTVPVVGFEDDNVPAQVIAGDVTGDGFTDTVILMVNNGGFILFNAPGFGNPPTGLSVDIADSQVVALRGFDQPDILLLTGPFDGGTLTSYRNDGTEVQLGERCRVVRGRRPGQ